MDQRDLNALAVAFQKGDTRSFRVLVESLSRTLIAMAYRYTEDWEWARDLTQDTWIKVHRQIGRWDSERSFSAWLHAVHRNGCLDHLRRGWFKNEATPGDEVVARLRGAAQEGPEEDLERREFHERLMAAAGQLSETQRQVFVRVDLEQGDQRAVAEAMGIKFGTLRATLHFARKRVAAVLREMETST
ncbi:MAG: RNA polymerase sigma factor [Gemmatimonadetes bacterium]|nr:RNA polymerase sigma factor [Gemmatimonadota bacterium]NNM03711.1 RNA polymerase sigma factor [Gemmatimonadota bacterium]